MIYPWHHASWQQLIDHWQQPPQAWLLTGKANIGKTAFAQHLAQALLCETPTVQHEPCGICPSCHLFSQYSHPDFYTLTPEIPEGESGGRKLLQIKIDAVREVIEHIQLTSVRGGKRVVLIQPAESMNLQAANALLKILEEPPENVIFLLVSHSRDKLLPTIKSRCRQWILPAPTHAEALAYLHHHHAEHAAALLAFHGGAPLFEANAEQDALRNELLALLAAPRLLAILDYAHTFDQKKWALAVFLDWLQKWLLDIGLAYHNLPPQYYPNQQAALQHIAEKTTPATLFDLVAQINRLMPYGHHTLSVKMQLESLLTEYLHFWQNK